MAKFKQLFSGVLKYKAEPKYMVSQYELNRLCWSAAAISNWAAASKGPIVAHGPSTTEARQPQHFLQLPLKGAFLLFYFTGSPVNRSMNSFIFI